MKVLFAALSLFRASVIFSIACNCQGFAYAATPEDLFAGINRWSPAERQKKLEEGAKQEASLKLFTTGNVPLLNAYTKAFMQKYPFVKVEYWRMPHTRLMSRVQLEHRRGKLEADIVGVSTEGATLLKREGVWASYPSPESRHYPTSFYDPQGYWHSNHLGLATIAYNKNLVKPEEAPKDYPDLLDPKWKGELSIDMDPERALMGWLITWGESRTRDFLNKLLKNGAVVRHGHTLQLQLLCAGEMKIGVELYAYSIAQMKHEKGCPAAMVFPNPTPAALGVLTGVTRSASHPHAAALFVDFMLSARGAEILAAAGQIPGRKGVGPIYEDLADLEAKGVRLLIISPEKAAELVNVMAKITADLLIPRRPQ
jgi:iron(III) transport system substrate-binding protein